MAAKKRKQRRTPASPRTRPRAPRQLAGNLGTAPRTQGPRSGGPAEAVAGDWFDGDLPSTGTDLGDMEQRAFVVGDAPAASVSSLGAADRDLQQEQARRRLGVALAEFQRTGASATPPEPNRQGTRAVIGDDDRRPIHHTQRYPFRVVCALLTSRGGQQSLGTGWLAGPQLVVTAGHNLFNNPLLGGGWVDSVHVFPGRDGSSQPFGASLVQSRRRLVVSQPWHDSGTPLLDYGAILLDQPLGRQTGWFSLQAWPAGQLQDMLVNVIGYPQHRQITMWGDAGLVIRDGVRMKTLRYLMDTEPGQSGAPLIYVPAGQGPGEPVFCVGIHNNFMGQTNSATRVTESVLANIETWLQMSQQP